MVIHVEFAAETLLPSHFTLPVVAATVALTATRALASDEGKIIEPRAESELSSN